MSAPAVGLADLLRALDELPPERWDSAGIAFGFGLPCDAKPDPARTANDLEQNDVAPRRQPEDTPGATEGGDQAAAKEAVDTLAARQVFWRVASDVTDPEAVEEVPAWVTDGPAPTADEFDGPAGVPEPVTTPLARRGQVAAFLRRHLAQARPTAELDLRRIVRAVVRQQPLRQVPRRQRARWPQRVQLVYDSSRSLHPLQHDLRPLAQQLTQILGPRLQVLLAHTLPGGLRDVTGRPARLAVDGSAVVVLGDAGMGQPGSAAQERWVNLGRQLAAAGRRPLLLAPVPRRKALRDTAAAFDTALLGEGRSLRLARPGRLRPEAGPLPVPHDGAVLRAALFGNPWVTPALLRDLRLALAARGYDLDVGSETDLWRERAISSNALACSLTCEAREAAAAAFSALPDELRGAVAMLHWRHLAAESPLVRAEYARAVHPRLPAGSQAAQVLAEGLAEGRRLAERSCAALLRGEPGCARSLAAYMGRLGRRGPELIASGDDALQAAWTLAHRDALAHGHMQPPAGLRSERLAWIFRRQLQDLPALAVTLVTHQADTPGGSAWAELAILDEVSLAPNAARLAGGLRAPWIQVRTLSTEWPSGTTVDSAEGIWTVAAGSTLRLEQDRSHEIRAGERILTFEPFQRPDWARAVRFESGQWIAAAPDGRELVWVPRRTYRRSLDSSEVALHLHAAWCDWQQCAQHPGDSHGGGLLVRPSWARRDGTDEYGYWAEFTVQGRSGPVTQRLRWIPPGEFWMGSPEGEAERVADGNYAEILHRVVLTQGYWLADSACTQALWEAVVGENPSRFKDAPSNPVEQVSWNDIHVKFLPALNRLVPGLEAVLPSEAQWEYACRAGTQTPFWFGEQITPEQVNYDGNHPYARGKKGEYRGKTVPVKSLPANGWGLYEMHGNLLEWCEDVLGDYPNEAVVDPRGPQDGVEGRRRVLRGGSWFNGGRFCRSAYRNAFGPDVRNAYIGFRLARGLGVPPPAGQGAGGARGQRAEPVALERSAARAAGIEAAGAAAPAAREKSRGKVAPAVSPKRRK